MIYIHIPFCRSFCTYCDFYSEVAARCRKADEQNRQQALFEEYGEALALEIQQRREEMSDEVNTLYIGGGTPSVLPLSVFARILDTLRSCGHGVPYEEFTVEVNPEDIVEKGHDYVEGLLDLGVNRISMGVQSFDDEILKWMNRRHDSAAARKAYSILEEAGVSNISIDLIFGLSQLSDAQWKDTLSRALDISSRGVLPQHISSYQLSVEPGSALARMVEKGLWSEASEDLCIRQYDALCETFAAAGYNHYEISNFALPGYEAKHNSAYWRHVPYTGLGPGAHSCTVAGSMISRQWNDQNLNAYLDAARRGDFATVRENEILTQDQYALEHVMLALRTSQGLEKDFLENNCDAAALTQAFAAGNLVSLPSGNVRIPEDRFFISDSIISDIV